MNNRTDSPVSFPLLFGQFGQATSQGPDGHETTHAEALESWGVEDQSGPQSSANTGTSGQAQLIVESRVGIEQGLASIGGLFSNE